jgi:septal ring factor EnvC (AmiA/AmiB activator)
MARTTDSRYQGLVTTGIVLSALLLLLIMGTAAFTSLSITARETRSEIAESIDVLTETADGEEVVVDDGIDYSTAYTEASLATAEQTVNDLYAKAISLQQANTNNSDKIKRSLIELATSSDELCDNIHRLRQNLIDTVRQTGDYGNPNLTAAYFNTDTRSDELKQMLYNYRNAAMQNLQATMGVSPSSPLQTLALEDVVTSKPIGIWKPYVFYDEPNAAADYLLQLEISVRYFEYDVMYYYPN